MRTEMTQRPADPCLHSLHGMFTLRLTWDAWVMQYESYYMTQIMSEITGYLFVYYHADPLGTNIQPSW